MDKKYKNRKILIIGILLGIILGYVGHILGNYSYNHNAIKPFLAVMYPLGIFVLTIVFLTPKKWDYITQPLMVYTGLFFLFTVYLLPIIGLFFPFPIFFIKLHTNTWVSTFIVVFFFAVIIWKAKKDKN